MWPLIIKFESSLHTRVKPGHDGVEKSKRAAGCPAALAKSFREEAYFRLLIAVRSNESLATPAALHQLEPKPPGLMGVKLPVNFAV